MSSNISITRICQHCGKSFEAKTTVTKNCSDDCAKRAYKLKAKQDKIRASNVETQKIRDKPLDDIRSKDYLTVREVALLLACAPRTVYVMIESGRLRAVNLSERKIRIHKKDVEGIFENPIFTVIPKVEKKDKKVVLKVEDCYSVGQIEENYEIANKTLYELLKRNNVEKIQVGKYVYVSKEIIHNLLGNYKKIK
ncbi:helix-turn-helix domain-containing protein [Chryseobacterium herbae]|uniref:Helix-turn-helix domain-containing protein n=1 Tax=Chryseobacterium herbae TaxID=2976476 RepID=A0ABT2ISF4_9FLAO|nr:helix-turn-helix domain-containing protein [Chryseobacterium sp. pc1-10]MCT2561758.1 helix-turn-helix domain-containing protein [Chryseobacterium sp. pc1-10]